MAVGAHELVSCSGHDSPYTQISGVGTYIDTLTPGQGMKSPYPLVDTLKRYPFPSMFFRECLHPDSSRPDATSRLDCLRRISIEPARQAPFPVDALMEDREVSRPQSASMGCSIKRKAGSTLD